MITIFDEYFDGFIHPIPDRLPDREFKKEIDGVCTVEKAWDVENGVIRTIDRTIVENDVEELHRLLKQAVDAENYSEAAVYKELIDEKTIYKKNS